MSAKFLKNGAPVRAINFANVINLSIKLDNFPSKCKIGKIKSLPKTGHKTEVKNYRPISQLSLIPKVIEKISSRSSTSYLQRNELLYVCQSGFIANHSTDTFFSRLTNMTLNSAENGKHLNNLQKAFDTLDPKILLHKIKYIAFSDKAIKWFHSYLTSRTFFVSLNNVFSESGTIKYRVLQGFI